MPENLLDAFLKVLSGEDNPEGRGRVGMEWALLALWGETST